MGKGICTPPTVTDWLWRILPALSVIPPVPSAFTTASQRFATRGTVLVTRRTGPNLPTTPPEWDQRQIQTRMETRINEETYTINGVSSSARDAMISACVTSCSTNFPDRYWS